MKTIKKKFRITFNAPVVLGLIFICFAATLLGEITKGRSTALFFMTYHSSLLNPLTYIRFITHVFGHAGWEHFIGNATYLLLLGPVLEEKYKSRTLIEIIIITAHRYYQLYLFPKYCTMRSPRNCLCLHYSGFIYRI